MCRKGLIFPTYKKSSDKDSEMILANISKIFITRRHFDASAADDFWKHNGKRRNCLEWGISPFATKFSTLFNNSTFVSRDFPNLCLYVFKVVCCGVLVWGKGLMKVWLLNRNELHPYVGGFNPFPHTTILQQTTLNIFCHKNGKSL